MESLFGTFSLARSERSASSQIVDRDSFPGVCSDGTLTHIRKLKDLNGDQIYDTDERSMNCFHVAAQHGRLDVLRELKSWNFDIHATDDYGYNAMLIAAGNGDLDVLRELKGSRNVRPSSTPRCPVSAQRDRKAKSKKTHKAGMASAAACGS